MLAICSDLDETPDRRVYWETAKFLNTNQTTALGDGVALEVGNSIYFDMPHEQFAYWNTDEAGRQMVRMLIRSGHIDCLHSYGDLAASRRDAQRALDELATRDCRLQVWVDHGKAPTNFGADIMFGHGDEPDHEAYHADLTLAYGVRFVSRGRATSVLGQDIPPRMREMLSGRPKLAAGKTFAKEQAKRLLGRLGSAKYDIHVANEVLRPVQLRNGLHCFEFLRCNPCPRGVSCCETARQLGRVLTDSMLDRLAQHGGLSVLYTHLGKIHPSGIVFDVEAIASLRRLSAAQQAGCILTTTTRRLLGYALARRKVLCHQCVQNGATRIDLDTQGNGKNCIEPADLQGLTIYTEGGPVAMFVDGRPLGELAYNNPDETGRSSVSVPWKKLEFPQP